MTLRTAVTLILKQVTKTGDVETGVADIMYLIDRDRQQHKRTHYLDLGDEK